MKKTFYLILFLTLLPGVSAKLIINEIMADPLADESLNEWVEIYNNAGHETDIKNFFIGDDQENDTFQGGLYYQEGTIIPAYGYAIITDYSTRVYNNFNVSESAVRLYISDSSIGSYGLNNNGQNLYLYDSDNNLVDSVYYNTTSEDLSWALDNSSWLKAEPTPGYNNNGTFFPDTSQGCDYQIGLILADNLFDSPENFSFQVRASKIQGTTTNITVKANIKDLYYSIIKEYRPFTNESITWKKTSSTYTPNLDEGKSYLISTNITTSCNDSNLVNNYDSRLITIKGPKLEPESQIDIRNIYDLGNDNKAKFGQIIRIRLEIYKGDTNKKTVYSWIEDKDARRLTKQSKVNVYDKFSNYSLTIPLQVDPNCDKSFNDGNYYLVSEGLDSEDSEKIEVEDLTNSLCQEIAIQQKDQKSKKFEYKLIGLSVDDNLKNIAAKVNLTNNDNKGLNIRIWGYLYRGKKSYSGNRENNLQEFFLPAKYSEIIELENDLIDINAGDYKYKVLINKNNQKTNYEIIKDISIKSKSDENLFQLLQKEDPGTQLLEETESQIISNSIYKLQAQPKLVYQSSQEKIRNLVFIFLITLSITLNIILFLVKSPV